MTEAELSHLESMYGGEQYKNSTIRLLCQEVRAAWSAINDMRQDSDAYRRAIADAVRMIRRCREDPTIPMEWQAVGERIASLALTRDCFDASWNGEPTPLAVIYDIDMGDGRSGGRFVDLDTGEEFTAPIKRWCPDGGWYEELYPWPLESGNPPKIRRVWRRFRYEVKASA